MTEVLCYLPKQCHQNYIARLLTDVPAINCQFITRQPSQGFYLAIQDNILQLCLAESPLMLRVNFLSFSMQARIDQKTKKLDIVKAVTGRAKQPLYVLDMTAGLGQDALTLAGQGHKVTALEQNPYVFILLKQGLLQAKQAGLSKIISNITPIFGDAVTVTVSKGMFDVIYLDPMFPVRQKTAKAKKNMQLLKMLISHSTENDFLLFDRALSLNGKKVIVKRPRVAAFLANKMPTSQLIGKSSRFDIYVNSYS